ncbi:MAG: DsbA family protein [Bacteroidia bacterium]|nr:DsbA family protein [Bacteroidia bacterium]
MQAKTKIIYVFDPMCGWCYGFSAVIQKAAQKYAGEFDFEIISGGMVVGEREGPVGDFADYILSAYKRVEEASGVIFGEAYLAQLKTKQLYSSSVKPAIAIEVFKNFHPLQAITFAAALQKAYFMDGLDLSKDEVYKALIKPYGINETIFLKSLNDDAMRKKTYDGFKQAANLGVNGYPAVMAFKNGKYYALTNGFTDYETLEKSLEKIKNL